jgi:hypothetical protein
MYSALSLNFSTSPKIARAGSEPVMTIVMEGFQLASTIPWSIVVTIVGFLVPPVERWPVAGSENINPEVVLDKPLCLSVSISGFPSGFSEHQ